MPKMGIKLSQMNQKKSKDLNRPCQKRQSPKNIKPCLCQPRKRHKWFKYLKMELLFEVNEKPFTQHIVDLLDLGNNCQTSVRAGENSTAS